MKIKLELSTGKVIELTQEEYEELVGKKLEQVFVPYHGITYPYPIYPWYPNYWEGTACPTITYSDGTNVTTTNVQYKEGDLNT